MKKRAIAGLIASLLAVNSLSIVSAGATIPVEQNAVEEAPDLYDETGVLENDTAADSVTAEEIPVVEEEILSEGAGAEKNEKSADSPDISEDEGSIPIDAEHFPDERFRDYLSGEDFDKNQDGVFSPEEIKGITGISGFIYEYEDEPSFSDMTGVENFTNLTFLSISISESMGTVDFSKFPYLESLTVEYSTMPTVDITGNKQIKRLYVDGTISQITLPEDNIVETLTVYGDNLDFSCLQNMTKLRSLELLGEEVEELNTDYCTELETLILDVETLPMLDLTSNEELKRLEIIGTSEQKFLDLSKNRKMEHLEITSGNDNNNYGYVDAEGLGISFMYTEQIAKLKKNTDGSFALNSLNGYRPDRLKAVYGAKISETKLYPQEQYVTYEYYLDSQRKYYGTFTFDCGKRVNPNAITGLTITGRTETSISSSWSRSKDIHTGYVIYAKNAATGVNERRVILKKGTTSYNVTGLKPGGRYEIIVRAYRTYNKKNYYSVYYKGTVFSYTRPLKPTLKISTSGANVKYTWTHQRAAYREADSGYLLYYSTKKNGPYIRGAIMSDTDRSFSTTLPKGRTYYFKMRAYVQYTKMKAPVFSKFSNVVSKKL